MALTTRTVETEEQFVRTALADLPTDKVDALVSAWRAISEDVASSAIDLRDVLNVGLHNLTVIIHRSPEFKAASVERGLATARYAMENGGHVMVSPNVSPKRLAYLTGTVVAVDAARKAVRVKAWDGEHLLAASLILPDRGE